MIYNTIQNITQAKYASYTKSIGLWPSNYFIVMGYLGRPWSSWSSGENGVCLLCLYIILGRIHKFYQIHNLPSS